MKSAQWTSLLAACGLALVVWFLAADSNPQTGTFLKEQEAESVSVSPETPAAGTMPEQTALPLTPLPEPQPLFAVSEWVKAVPDLRPLAPDEPKAARAVLAKGSLVPESLPELQNLKPGDRISLPLRNGGMAQGVVNLVQPDESGWVRVGGSVKTPEKGSFSMSQKGGEWAGLVQLPAQEIALVIDTAGDGGLHVLEKPLNSVLCRGLPKKPQPDGDLRNAPGGGGASASPVPPPLVPPLDSLPAATAVVYIDFDGELITDPDWNDGFTINALPARLGTSVINAAQMTNIWQRVSEDLRPFNISVTTIRTRYDGAAPGSRMRCIVTATDYWFPNAGGVAYLESFSKGGTDFSSTVPSWAFVASYYTTADISGIITHEVGHTFGLEHDNVVNSQGDVVDEYYGGHGSWGAIMGTTYGRRISQWSKGEYKNAGNFQDDLAIIGNTTNGFGLVTDEAGGLVTQLPNTGVFAFDGVVASADDDDVFRFETAGGPVNIRVNADPVEPNLNVKVDLLNEAGSTVLQSASPAGNMNATLSRTLAAGVYRIRIQGVGEGDPLGTGFTAYGSVGRYSLSGTFPAIPDEFPFISQHPQNVEQMVGSRVSFSVNVLSNTALRYQWQRNGVDIPRATGSSHVISRAQPAAEGTYRCVVTNGFGSVNSDPADLTLRYKPLFTQHPARTLAGTGTPVTLSVQVQATAPLALQWQKDKINIDGATSPDLTIPSAQFLDGGSYRCVATNSYGSTISRTAILTVTSAPVITQEPPAALGVPLRGSATISLKAVGSPTLRYQWLKNDVRIPGATRPMLTLTRITAETGGVYRCEVSNAVGGPISSAACTVTPGEAPVLLTQPSPAAVNAGAAFSMNVTATGEPTLSYQWLRDGLPVGADAPSYDVLSAQWEDQASYRVRVSNAYGSVISRAVSVKVNAAPNVVESPASRKVARGSRFTLTLGVTGSPALKYQWRMNGANIKGATSPRLTQTGSQTGTYDCVVTNPFGSDTSLPCVITVEDAPIISRLPTLAVAALGASFQYNAAATGSATLSYEWRRNNMPLAGQTSSLLSLTNVQAADAGTYTVVVSNDVGTRTSTPMRLSIVTGVSITTPPQDLTVHAFDPASFSVTAAGAGPLRYQWLRDGMEIPGATKAQFTVPSVESNAVFTVRVSNAAGSATSSPAQLTVLPVTAPTLSTLAPRRANPGHFVRMTGSGLKWTTQVRFEKAGGGFVTAAFVIISNTELLATVPAGTASSAPVHVTTRGGSAMTSTTFTPVTAPPNDFFVNARIISGMGAKITGTMPRTFGPETGEPAHAYSLLPDPDPELKATYSAWHAFTPTRSGTHIVSTAGSAFDTRVAIYTGGSVSTLTPVAANDDADYDNDIYFSYTRFEAVAGTTYHMAVDGFLFVEPISGQQFSESGAYTLNVSYFTGNAIPTPEQSEAEDSIILGGVGVTEAALAWTGADGIDSGKALEETVTRFAFSAPESGDADTFGWTAYDAGGQPVLGLGIDPQSRELLMVDVQGVTTSTGQILVPGQSYELRFWKDAESGGWGAFLNGERIVRLLPLAPGVDISDLSVQWRPGPAGAGRGDLEIQAMETVTAAP